MRGTASHALAFSGRRIAGPNPGVDVDLGQTGASKLCAYAREWDFEIAVDVVRECFERRHIDDLGLIGEGSAQPLPNEIIDRREKRRESLSGTRRRGDEGMLAGLNCKPRLHLHGGCRGKGGGKPIRNSGLEQHRKLHVSDD